MSKQNTAATPNPRQTLREAWPLVLAGFVISFVVVGGGIDTVSVFLKAISAATEWSRSSLSAAVSLGAAMAALSTPLVGILIDRFGVRVPMLLGVGLLGLGFLIVISMQAPWQFALANIFLGPGFAACALLPVTVAITVGVPGRTALALGIVGAGASTGALVLAPAAQAATEALGWRGAYVVLGLAVILTPLPWILFAFPRGKLGKNPGLGGSAPAWNITSGLRRPGVIALAAVMILPGLTMFSVSVHLVPYLTDIGHSGSRAAAALGATIGISAIGKVAGGFLGDRIGAAWTLCGALVIDALAFAVLLGAASAPLLAAFAVLHGLAFGTQIAVTPPIAMGVLGSERFGTLFGILQLSAMLAAALGPAISGLLFDLTGRYNPAIVLWLGSAAIAALVSLRLPGVAAGPLAAPAGRSSTGSEGAC